MYTINTGLTQETSCLFLIDLQERLMAAMEKRGTVLKNAGILLAGGQTLNLPLIVTEQYPKGLGHIVSDLSLPPDASLFEKTKFSAWDERTEAALAAAGRKQILLFGSETHICVLQTVRDLLAAGYDVWVVSDACCSRTEQNHQISLNYMQAIGAHIVSTELVLFDLLKAAGSPEFKLISGLIK